jgi:hypothetical protein
MLALYETADALGKSLEKSWHLVYHGSGPSIAFLCEKGLNDTSSGIAITLNGRALPGLASAHGKQT